MNLMLNRLDPHVPDPVESRRRAAGRMVRIAYATIVFGVLAFFVIYFGRPLVYLSGPGVVSAPRYMVSLPYVVQISHLNVTPGSTVALGEEIGRVQSPQQEGVVATYMRALAEIAGREADLRVKARVAAESLETARAYLRLTEEAVNRIEASPTTTVTFRVGIYRERALARKNVVSLEAEAAAATAQLASLDEVRRELRERLDGVERHFADGRISAPIAGVISTNLAHLGQALVAGTPIAEILDPKDVFVDWYIPNERFRDPRVGNDVVVLFGNRRISGKIVEILPVSDVYAAKQPTLTRDRAATQIARVRFDAGEVAPALSSTVHVRMYYSDFVSRAAARLVRLVGFH
jgi:multidrug resistance efflux pump